MIKILIFIIVLSIPLSLIYLNLNYQDVEGKYLFTMFAIFVMLERIWETFYTPRDKQIQKFRGDWTLLATSFMYFLVCLFIIFSFYSTITKNFSITVIGLIIFIAAGLLRFWAVKTLGHQWSIHLTDGLKQENNSNLIKIGPYKYIRHPIYLGIIFELVGIALVANSFYFIIFILFINTPLYIMRALYEEKISLIKFGNEFGIYSKQVPFMFPFKLSKIRSDRC